MTIGVGPLFRLKIPAILGERSYDRAGYVRLSGDWSPSPMPGPQMAALSGTATQQLIKRMAANPAYWQAYLAKALTGSHRARYMESLGHFAADPAINPTSWEAAANEAGLYSIYLDEVNETEVSPGAQLFALASNLSGLGLLAALSRSTHSAWIWKDEAI